MPTIPLYSACRSGRLGWPGGLLPLQLATLCSGMMLWVPIEKLFINEIGFTAPSVGLMAGVYAITVPMLEIPSGLLADRWSRKGVLIAATVALVGAVGVGAVANSVGVYMVSALCLGVFIAMHSGTVDSIIYDTLFEEGADTAVFDRLLGWLGMLSSVTLVGSSLLGGCLASVWSPRLAYVATLPFVIGSLVCLAFVREPHVHRPPDTGEPARNSLLQRARSTMREHRARADELVAERNSVKSSGSSPPEPTANPPRRTIFANPDKTCFARSRSMCSASTTANSSTSRRSSFPKCSPCSDSRHTCDRARTHA